MRGCDSRRAGEYPISPSWDGESCCTRLVAAHGLHAANQPVRSLYGEQRSQKLEQMIALVSGSLAHGAVSYLPAALIAFHDPLV